MQFTVAFTLPYLLNAPYANLGSKVGLIFGTISFLSLVFVYLCVPECKGRTLEEVDMLFELKIPMLNIQSTVLPADVRQQGLGKGASEVMMPLGPKRERED
ncbi:sugar transporter [Colletotrichum salicis]|uniref:Sugar transporter n=1 Tax=Colletotrichum salicis TaxID=1209931 RepID=A0A135U559_9PEZI|nr:sugar transporter [Colletotrichum salicis]